MAHTPTRHRGVSCGTTVAPHAGVYTYSRSSITFQYPSISPMTHVYIHFGHEFSEGGTCTCVYRPRMTHACYS
eukprot:COSAG02_NODE_3760_length_6272_cov_13.055565_3_plen_73_part_00